MGIFKKVVIITMILFMGRSSFASDSASYQGYYVSRIIENTVTLFEEHNLLNPYSKITVEWNRYYFFSMEQEYNKMLPGITFFDFENSFINYCLVKNLITYKQAKKAIEESKNYGGLTLNGYNLLVLHAEILWALTINKHLTVKEAQNLLDSSRRKN
jgi:hypothetical protein